MTYFRLQRWEKGTYNQSAKQPHIARNPHIHASHRARNPNLIQQRMLLTTTPHLYRHSLQPFSPLDRLQYYLQTRFGANAEGEVFDGGGEALEDHGCGPGIFDAEFAEGGEAGDGKGVLVHAAGGEGEGDEV